MIFSVVTAPAHRRGLCFPCSASGLRRRKGRAQGHRAHLQGRLIGFFAGWVALNGMSSGDGVWSS